MHPLPLLVLPALALALVPAHAAPPRSGAAATTGIYSCVDASGRRLTSDRPIAACLDREQTVRSSTGVVKQVLPPSYTGAERAALDARAAEQARAQDAQRAAQRSNAMLLQRYPDPATLASARQRETDEVLAHVRDGYARLDQLRQEQTRLEQEAAFYRRNPQSMPGSLRAAISANTEQQQTEQKYIAQQRQALVQAHQRFDREAAQLAPVWPSR